MDIYKYLNISIGTVMKNQDMLKCVRNYLKAKKMCKHAVKKLPYLLRYVLDRYKTQQMCHKEIIENGTTLKFQTATKIKKYVIKQLIITLMHDKSLLNTIRLN